MLLDIKNVYICRKKAISCEKYTMMRCMKNK